MNLQNLLKKTYGDAIGPLGFPMSSKAATETETFIKQQPAEIKSMFSTRIGDDDVEGYVRTPIEIKAMDTDPDKRIDISLITSSAVDRDREMLMPDGCDPKFFQKNPIVPFNHDYESLPVGRSLWIKRDNNKNLDKDGWKAATYYPSSPESWKGDWFPDAVFHMITEGMCLGKSVGFLPMDGRPPGEKDIKARPSLSGCRFMITKWAMLEYSVAPIQSNPHALVEAVKKCCKTDFGLSLERLGIYIPDEMLTMTELLFQKNEEPSGEDEEQEEPPTIKEVRFKDLVSDSDVKAKVDAAFARINPEEIVRNVLDRLAGRV